MASGGLTAICVLVLGALWLRTAEAVDALERAEAAYLGTSTAADSASSAAPEPSSATSGLAPSPSPAGSAATSAAASPSSLSSGTPLGSSVPVAEGPRASDAELAEAKSKGAPAVEQLLTRYPNDPRVLRALVLAYSIQKNHASAISAATRLLIADPAQARDPDVVQTIMLAANGPPNAAAVAFDLMTSKMGSHGPDLLYSLLNTSRAGSNTNTQSARALAKPEVRVLATPALLIALDLKNTQPCARKELYARAREVGDERSLFFLRPLTIANGCGNILRRRDCFPCLEPRQELHDTIAAIQKRLATPAKP